MITQYRKLSRKRKVFLALIELGVLYAVVYIAGYSLRSLQTWFSLNFQDNLALLFSFSSLVLAGALMFFGLLLYERNINFESTIEYPKEIPEADYSKWSMLASQIKIKRDSPLYMLILCLPTLYIGYVLMFTSVWCVGSLARYHYIDFLSKLPAFQQAFFALGLLIVISLSLTVIPMLLTLNLTNSFMTKYLGYPSDEDIIFAETLIINYRLFVKDRKGAKKEIDAFLKSLTRFSRGWLNDRRKAYSQEISKLVSNKNALSRLVMFTPDSLIDDIRLTFLKFGLSLRNWDDPECLKSIQLLSNELNDYKPTSRIQKIAGSIETYPKTITICAIVVSIILFILGYPQIASLIKG